MDKQPLHRGWNVRAVSNVDEVPSEIWGKEIPATVPGCVHTDLLAASLIPDPYLDRNESQVQWIGRTDWSYRTTFVPDSAVLAHDRVELVADGLDTIATVRLNGQVIGRAHNMHHPHRFDVKNLLKAGENELEIVFSSAVAQGYLMQDRLGKLPKLNTDVPFNFIRKMACNFGWDWGPVLTTCGIWRGLRLEGWSGARIIAVRPMVRTLAGKHTGLGVQQAELDVVVDLERSDPSKAIHVDLNLRFGPYRGKFEWERDAPAGALAPAVTQVRIPVRILEPQLWWPNGYGDQPLYWVQVFVTQEGQGTCDEATARFGLRTVELDTSPDDVGSKFVLKVNGKSVFCKGFNWIPDDCFLNRATTPLRYRTRIRQALDANANMLRVWGGGIYETNEFYDICDEMGVLVWQDFLFACAAYPEEEPIRSQVAAEVRYNVMRLSRHPSLVIWNGCNENLWGYLDWGWKESKQLEGRTWGPGYYLDMLPKIVGELDPTRPYWPASPFSGRWCPEADPRSAEVYDKGWIHPNASRHGNKHVWEAWFGEAYDAYRNFTPRFCSEFGFQGPATYATMARALPADQLKIGSPGMRAHQKSPGGDERNTRHLAKFFEVPADFNDWLYLMQLNQARALTLGVEWFRSRMPVCMGTLYWQLNDCWPVTSWSAIDGDGRFKPLYYATRRFYAPRLLTIQPEADGKLVLHAINDHDEPWQGNVIVQRMTLTGKALAQHRLSMQAEPRGVWRLPVDPSLAAAGNAQREMLVASIGPERAFYFFDVDKNLEYPPAELDLDVRRTHDGQEIIINARTFVRDAALFVDRLDDRAVISDQLINLLPGDRVVLKVTGARALQADELGGQPVFQCANRFGRRE